MPKVNPAILVWARETAGLPLAEAARKLGYKDSRRSSAASKLAALENGATEPTRPQLTRMAQHYRRPLLAFYLPEPPAKGHRGADFRTLPAAHSDADNALLDALVRDARARQSMTRAVLEDADDVEPLPFVASHTMADGPAAVLASLRRLLGVDLAEYRAQSNAAAAFNLLRGSAEKAGIFVLLMGNLGTYHTDLGVEVFRGCAIADDLAPFIVVNPNDEWAEWSFTLLHELTHLLLGHTGIGRAYDESDTEQFCDDVAAEFMLPAADLPPTALTAGPGLAAMADNISAFANARHLGRAMVAYKAGRAGWIEPGTFNDLKSHFRREWVSAHAERRRQARERGGGANPYVVRRHRLGPALISLVQEAMASNALTTDKAARVLGVHPGQLDALFNSGKRR